MSRPVEKPRFTKDERAQPFSNGFEFRMWMANNCERGCKGCRNYRPDASTSRDGCPIEVALALASCTDGQVRVKHLLRGGFLEPASDGLLTWAEGDPSTWECPEYRGYDEPDGRPRRGPKLPADQLDIFDPRNAPTKERVRV